MAGESITDRLKRILRIPREPQRAEKRNEWARKAGISYYHKYLRGKVSGKKYTRFLEKIESDASISPGIKDAIYRSYIEAMKIREFETRTTRQERKTAAAASPPSPPPPPPTPPPSGGGGRQPSSGGEPMMHCELCGARIRASMYQRNGGYCDRCVSAQPAGLEGTFLQKELEKGARIPKPTLRGRVGGRLRSGGGRFKKWFRGGPSEPTPEEITPLSESFGKRTQSRIYEVFISILIGVFFLMGTPFFGLPPFEFLGFAFIFFIPAYIIFPSEYEILGSIREGSPVTGRAWLLVPKSAFKLVAYFLIVWQFFIYNRLISLVIAFIFYFFLPGRYKTTQPAKAIEAWARLGFGVYLAYVFFLTFGGAGIAGNNMAVSLGWMGAAFFITFPIQIEGDKDESKITVIVGKYKSLTDTGAFKVFDRGFFLIAMFISLWFFISSGGNLTDMTHVVFYLIWGLSLLVGISAGPEARPAMGVMTILIALFIFSTTYTGVVGQAIFGYWWPQVQSTSELIFEPLSDMWGQAQSGMSDAWMMLTNPQQYYLIQTQKQQATRSTVKSGGTTKSIEFSRFDLSPSIPGILEPSEPVIANMELQNGGDFVSGEIILDIEAVGVDAVEQEEYTTGIISNLYCSNINISPSPSSHAQCRWLGKTYPNELRAVTFKLKEGDAWDSDPDHKIYSSCMNNAVEPPDEPIPCPCFTNECPIGNTTYEYSGTTVKLNANLTYDYVVNVSMPVTIIGSERYIDKLQAKEIILQDLTSEYTGGPVKATLFTQKQPARTDIPFLVVASIYNDGSGDLLEINDFTITIYGEGLIENVEVIGTTFRRNAPVQDQPPDGCDSVDTTTSPGNFIITCDNLWPERGIERGEFKRVSFYIHPIDNADLIESTTQIVAWTNYKYLKQKSQTLTVANAPPQ